jgi:hypothetical protein
MQDPLLPAWHQLLLVLLASSANQGTTAKRHDVRMD